MSLADQHPGLAEALDRALTERVSPATVLNRELAELLEFAEYLQISAAEVRPTAEFRATARQRLRMAMARSNARAPSQGVSVGHQLQAWLVRFAASLAALGLVGTAASSASASALPGDPLYAVKQAGEVIALQLATTESRRDEVLLHQADTRLDEAARLLQQGRSADVADTTARYEYTIGTLTEATQSEGVQSSLQTKAERLRQLVQDAPVPTRAGLKRALDATDRSQDGSRPTGPASPPEVIGIVGTLSPEPNHSVPRSDADDLKIDSAQPSRPANAGESNSGEEHRPDSQGPGNNPAASRADPRSAHASPGHMPSQPTAVSRSQPGRRGRP